MAKGQLVAAGDLLVFLDEGNPDASFALERANIKSWNEQDGVITLDTSKAVKDRSGERNPRFAFRLVAGTGAALEIESFTGDEYKAIVLSLPLAYVPLFLFLKAFQDRQAKGRRPDSTVGASSLHL